MAVAGALSSLKRSFYQHLRHETSDNGQKHLLMTSRRVTYTLPCRHFMADCRFNLEDVILLQVVCVPS